MTLRKLTKIGGTKFWNLKHHLYLVNRFIISVILKKFLGGWLRLLPHLPNLSKIYLREGAKVRKDRHVLQICTNLGLRYRYNNWGVLASCHGFARNSVALIAKRGCQKTSVSQLKRELPSLLKGNHIIWGTSWSVGLWITVIRVLWITN